MRTGRRGLPGGSSLAQFLDEHSEELNDPGERLTVERVIQWADLHFKTYGSWPNSSLGRVLSEDSENWHAIDMALTRGYRGLHGGSSLAKLLDEHRRKKGSAS